MDWCQQLTKERAPLMMGRRLMMHLPWHYGILNPTMRTWPWRLVGTRFIFFGVPILLIWNAQTLILLRKGMFDIVLLLPSSSFGLTCTFFVSMSPCSTFKISGIDPSVTTRDIVRCLTGLQDSSGGRVNFEIVWVNDVCFIVGATLHSRDQKLFEEHGKIILNALGGRFKREMIQPLGTSGINAQQPSSSSSMWNLWGLLGSSKPAAAEPSESRPAKRRRVE